MLLEKLLSGKLDKHSEQLNKFVAGLFDSDGSVFVSRSSSGLRLQSSITQTSSKDPDFEIMRALQKHYKLGAISYSIPEKGSSVCKWILSSKDSLKLFNLLGKFLLIKATHFENCIALYYRYKGLLVSDREYEQIKEFSKSSRESSTYFKRPKHISPAYLAGLIAGDGHLQYKRYNGRNKINLCIASGDKVIIDLLLENFRGHVQKQNGCYIWRRALGRENRSFAMENLPKIRKFMLFKTKRNVIDRILKFHNAPAETK